MSRYTLKTYCGTRLLEQFNHRTSAKLKSILSHPKHDMAGVNGPFGETQYHANLFEIYDSQMLRLFRGNLDDSINYVKAL